MNKISIKNIKGYFNNNDRSENIKANVVGSIFLKGISIFLSLLVVPLTINYISPYQYGVWITISSIIGWLSFFDIGFGNGLKNKFVEAITTGKLKLARIYVSTTYSILALIILLIWVLSVLISKFVDWPKFLNVKGANNEELFYVMLIVLSTFAFQFVLGLINTILSALQKPVITSLINVISQFLVLIGIYVLSKTSSGSILNLSLLNGIVNTLVLFIFSIYLFKTSLKNYVPSLKFVRFRYAKGLLTLGLNFFILQIISIIYYETNNIIITKTLSPLDVTVYNLGFKYLSIIGMFFSIIISPFWSAFIEARVLNDISWMRSVTKKLYKIFGLFLLATLILVLCSSFVYNIWFGKSVNVPFLMTMYLGIWQIFNMWNSLHSTLIYGFGKIKLQIIASLSVGIVNIPLTVFFCQTWGLNGVVISQIILAMSIAWIGPLQLNLLFNKNAKRIWNK
ncbi:lipopolysaccharide biosynthesis protein [Flavobacterium sharifuzzamanii]|uniref:lipopolysaccharide biosynthesis protein n=1 Tax=Flavobacterium sharifuzzamanii TaxID=2211133 RepID=UPI000DAB9866|nr:polysaccharide biosynthesis protein [Flavobacterium sharifuzzamanii]KAF2081150.1 polysaccharide biosynthesis protein [Flavobacterium sharifuzzamanii]